MKHLPLIILLCFVACGKKHKPKKDSNQGIPYVLISDDVNDYLGSLTAGSTTGLTSAGGSVETQTTGAGNGGNTGSTTGGQIIQPEIVEVTTGGTSGSETTGGTSGSDTTGGTSGSETTGGTSGSETTGGTSGSETTGGTSGTETTGGTSGSETTGGTSGSETTGSSPVSLVDAKVVNCNFSNENEQQTLSMNISEQSGNKYAELSSDTKGKVEFDGFIFSPSSNSNAAVHSVDKNLKIDGKDVLKITARILFNPETGVGELQLSYKLKGKKGAEEQTAFTSLAEINHCSVIE